MARIAQSGIFIWAYKERIRRIYGAVETSDEVASQEIVIEIAQAPKPWIQLKNVYKLFRIYFILLSLASTVLWYEAIDYSVWKMKVLMARERMEHAQMNCERLNIRE